MTGVVYSYRYDRKSLGLIILKFRTEHYKITMKRCLIINL